VPERSANAQGRDDQDNQPDRRECHDQSVEVGTVVEPRIDVRRIGSPQVRHRQRHQRDAYDGPNPYRAAEGGGNASGRQPAEQAEQRQQKQVRDQRPTREPEQDGPVAPNDISEVPGAPQHRGRAGHREYRA
jgi:hypothetical protein